VPPVTSLIHLNSAVESIQIITFISIPAKYLTDIMMHWEPPLRSQRMTQGFIYSHLIKGSNPLKKILLP